MEVYFTEEEYKILKEAAEKEMREPENFCRYYSVKAAQDFLGDEVSDEDLDEDFRE